MQISDAKQATKPYNAWRFTLTQRISLGFVLLLGLVMLATTLTLSLFARIESQLNHFSQTQLPFVLHVAYLERSAESFEALAPTLLLAPNEFAHESQVMTQQKELANLHQALDSLAEDAMPTHLREPVYQAIARLEQHFEVFNQLIRERLVLERQNPLLIQHLFSLLQNLPEDRLANHIGTQALLALNLDQHQALRQQKRKITHLAASHIQPSGLQLELSHVAQTLVENRQAWLRLYAEQELALERSQVYSEQLSAHIHQVTQWMHQQIRQQQNQLKAQSQLHGRWLILASVISFISVVVGCIYLYRHLFQRLLHLRQAMLLPDQRQIQHLQQAQGQDEIGDMAQAFTHYQDLMHQREQDLLKAQAALEELAITDELTQLHNRRCFNQALVNELQRASRTQQSISLMMLDIDHFKLYNDHYGHPKGDEVLAQVGHLLRGLFQRAGDDCFRLGGEEFGVLLTNTSLAQAQLMAQRLQNAMAKANICHKYNPPVGRISLSIGVCSLVPTPDTSAEYLYACTDQALYQAKEHGRNRIVAQALLNLSFEDGPLT